ncbi:MAG TPA: iron ABC transporter permease [Gemmatimonadales bacterium]|jgi:iron complex transport system permease protein
MLKRLSHRSFHTLLAIGLGVAMLASASIGDFYFPLRDIVRFIGQGLHLAPLTTADALDRNVFLQLRLPRVLLGTVTGAVLGVSGTLMQGLFRNPIVEPGLVGTSAGAAFGAALVFVLGGKATLAFTAPLGSAAVPVLAFAGGFAATILVYRVSRSFGKVNVFTLLLAGIAVNAVSSAGTGFLSYIARDPQARNITFWNLGTFTTADWRGASIVTVTFAICYVLARRYGKALNALMLGEEEAAYTGLDPARFIWPLLVINTLMVAMATAMVGVIAFIGLVVPHLLRLVKSSDYTFLIPGSALLGAMLMEVIDVVARLVIAPAELPIGIITAVIGAPVFLGILIRQQRRSGGAFYG